ncbi:type I-E CRISPR-associated protein Cse1/CasA [Streptomyces wuyuanensis]|uniref:CRISPR system Cascade subunit CasA n=1 Tax=Streptomyces wuyuanensis TaxID=1196353 RepID=A0A1H0DTW3_9ACTN|nr:type I-E CRISPR-associated protein Cse1/CasA [Streptomyces wuyuanensis]SDN73463.1 CRISPR system Cascade subunit CasA [Streptomyces wuyuanensis]
MPESDLPSPRFSAADDPWIEVRTGHRYATVGLRELFLRADTIDDLALPHPPAASALLRIAVAITTRITGLDNADLTASEWTALRRRCLTAGRFEPDAVHAYFDAHPWSVFDPERPWLQDPSLREQCAKPFGINAFVPGRPAGNNLAWFSPHHHDNATPVPTAHALQYLLIHHYYGRPGTSTPRTTATCSSGKLTGGPLRGTVSFHPVGRTLHETLLAGCAPFTGDELPAADTCPWEDPAPPDPDAPPRPVSWPGRLLTGMSRHAILLVPGDDGATVTDAYLSWATQHPKVPVTDPYLTYHFDMAKPLPRRRSVRRADADRAWWRELDTLLLAGDEHGSHRRPAVFDTLNDLPDEVRTTLRIRVHGFDQDAKATDYQWYTALTPPLLHWMEEHDPQRAQRIADCCQAAESTARQLADVTRQAWEEAATPGRAGSPARPRRKEPAWVGKCAARYWPLAESVFWQLLDDPDAAPTRAFTRAAVTALRETTATARARHNSAARAVALAVRELYRRQPNPQRKTSR